MRPFFFFFFFFSFFFFFLFFFFSPPPFFLSFFLFLGLSRVDMTGNGGKERLHGWRVPRAGIPGRLCLSQCALQTFRARAAGRWSQQLLPGEYVSVIFTIASTVCLRASDGLKLLHLGGDTAFKTLRIPNFREVASSAPTPVGTVL